MYLKKDTWTKVDGNKFKEYLESLSQNELATASEKKLLRVSKTFYVMRADEINAIVEEIAKGNFEEFIDLWMCDNHVLVSILGGLICKLQDFNKLTKYISLYADQINHWRYADSLKFEINKENKQEFFDLSLLLVKHIKPLGRRIGIKILFKYIDDNKYIHKIFDVLNDFKDEKKYYVNMCNAWLIEECFARQRDKTLEFLKHHNLNRFTINKAITKCCNSSKISDDDKILLQSFKQVKRSSN